MQNCCLEAPSPSTSFLRHAVQVAIEATPSGIHAQQVGVRYHGCISNRILKAFQGAATSELAWYTALGAQGSQQRVIHVSNAGERIGAGTHVCWVALPVCPFLLDLRNAALFALAYLAAYGSSRFFAQRTGTRLWLPDSVLLCALLVAPRKKWWLYVLMTMPTRFVPGFRPQVAAWFLWLTWANDVGKGLLAASLLRYSPGTPIRFNSVRRYATYLGIAVLLTPMLSAFFGALTRYLALGHAFWPAFGLGPGRPSVRTRDNTHALRCGFPGNTGFCVRDCSKP